MNTNTSSSSSSGSGHSRERKNYWENIIPWSKKMNPRNRVQSADNRATVTERQSVTNRQWQSDKSDRATTCSRDMSLELLTVINRSALSRTLDSHPPILGRVYLYFTCLPLSKFKSNGRRSARESFQFFNFHSLIVLEAFQPIVEADFSENR